MSDTTTYLHIFGQHTPHDQCTVVGTAEALEALKSMVSIALQSGTCAMQFMANDGEYFLLRIVQMSDLDMSRLETPYSSKDFSDPDMQHIRVEKL